MVTKLLINIGLIATPFFVLGTLDIRDIKLDIAGMIALGIGLSSIYEYGLKPMRNKWLMIFLWVACSSYFLAPHVPVSMFGMDVTLFWVWKPMYYFVVFALMIFAVSSVEFKKKDIDSLLKLISWCGFVMGCYTILQYFGLDQIFQTCTDDTYGRMAGFVGNPTHVSPFIAMLIPICLYLRRKIMVIVMCTAVCLTTSTVAIGAMVISICLYVALQSRKNLIMVVCLGILTSIGVFFGINKGYITGELVADHQRFDMWLTILRDMKISQLDGSTQIFPFTGLGMGTFKYVFHLQHNNSFHQAHNDFLELLYNVGIIGFSSFMLAIIAFLGRNFKIDGIYALNLRNNALRLNIALLGAFVCLMVSAIGTFVLQIGTTAFYGCLIVGLLNNDNVGGTV